MTTDIIVRPKNLSEEEAAKVAGQATTMIEKVKNPSSMDQGALSKLTAFGSDAQQSAGLKIGLLQTKVGKLLNELQGDGGEIPRNLLQLRSTMDQINPHVLKNKPIGFVSKLLGKVPAVGQVLAQIAMKYETVQTQIEAINQSLYAGRDQIMRDSLELDGLYQAVRVDQNKIQEAIYLGKIFKSEIEKVLPTITDQSDHQRVSNILSKVARRIEDLMIMEQANLQFFMSIDTIIESNNDLAESVNRTVQVCGALLTVGLAIQAALANQKRTMQATKATQQYAADMLEFNAKAIKTQSIEIAQMQNEPLLALEKVENAFNNLLEAANEVDRIKTEGIAKANEGIRRLSVMSEKLSAKVDATHEARLTASPANTGLLEKKEG